MIAINQKKFNIPDNETIEIVMVDSTLLGIYGVLITDKRVYSKDILSQLVITNRDDLPQNYPVSIVEDSIRLDDKVVHTLPHSLDDVESVKTLITEILSGEIRN